MKNNNRGFTLIEIVMVLVLLGILAAVAIPKYYDLREKAEEQTAKAVAAEYQARVNAVFAGKLLESETCANSLKLALGEANKLFTDTEKGAHGYTSTGIDDSTTTSTAKLSLTKSGTEHKITIALPTCTAVPATPATGGGN